MSYDVTESGRDAHHSENVSLMGTTACVDGVLSGKRKSCACAYERLRKKHSELRGRVA
jgi:hypothetical protein